MAAATSAPAACAFFCFDVLINHFDRTHRVVPPAFNDDSFPLFVTWDIERHKGHKDLRGCIGNFTAMPLHTGLREYALISALQDRRFTPISEAEVVSLHCSVSLLLDFEDAANYLDWTVGLHGIWIEFVSDEGRKKTATYLPHVVEEQGWTKLQAIDSLLRKGGFRGAITEHTRNAVKLTRYQSSKCEVSYQQYLSWRQKAL